MKATSTDRNWNFKKCIKMYYFLMTAVITRIQDELQYKIRNLNQIMEEYNSKTSSKRWKYGFQRKDLVGYKVIINGNILKQV
jgi:hypothetical protein